MWIGWPWKGGKKIPLFSVAFYAARNDVGLKEPSSSSERLISNLCLLVKLEFS